MANITISEAEKTFILHGVEVSYLLSSTIIVNAVVFFIK